MNTIREYRDKIEVMEKSPAMIKGIELGGHIWNIGKYINGRVDNMPEKFALDCIYNDLTNLEMNDVEKQKHYREVVIPEVLRLTKMAQEKDPIANV